MNLALLTALAMANSNTNAIQPTPIYHGKKEPKPQRMGGPVLSSKRLWRLRKQSVNQVK